MEKDYYTKEEVDKLLSQLREDILSSKQNSQNLKKQFSLDFSHVELMDDEQLGRFEIFGFFELMKGLLEKKRLIEYTDINLFTKALRGREIKESEGPLVKWIGQKNLCIYFLEELCDHFNLNEKTLNKKSLLVFGVKNSKELKRNYLKNSKSLPRNYKTIDLIIDKCKEWANNKVKLKVEDDIYFKKYILTDIKNDIED
ncbi:MAG: hypothetical protein ACON30_00895 [Flavobacteriaceae bacterium]